jgi:glycosyl transferase family 25
MTAPFALFVVAHPAFRQRYDYITRHLSARSKQMPRLVGIVGRDVLAATPDLPRRFSLLPGEIGCALSHLAAYRIMVAENIPRAVVIEDDAALPDGFDDLARAVLGELQRGEVISFHSPNRQPNLYSAHGGRSLGASLGGSLLVTPMQARSVRTTLCYAIELGAARGILHGNDPVEFCADDFAAFHARGFVNHLRILSPSAVDLAAFESLMEYRRDAPVMRRVARLLNRTPGIRDILRLRRHHLHMSGDRNHLIVQDPSPLMAGNPAYEELQGVN